MTFFFKTNRDKLNQELNDSVSFKNLAFVQRFKKYECKHLGRVSDDTDSSNINV